MKTILVLFSLLLVGQLKAQINADRPDQTDSPATVGKGNLQIETGLQLGFEREGKISNRQILAPTTFFRYGITEKIEFRLLSQFETLKNANVSLQGISDLEIGAKIKLFKNNNNSTEIAFLTDLLMPTGTKELSNNKFGTTNKISISHEINEKTGIGYNVGYSYLGEGNGDLIYSVSLDVDINSKVSMYIELYGELTNFEEFNLNFDSGVSYLVNNNMMIDLSYGTGIIKRMNYLAVGFSWLINKEN